MVYLVYAECAECGKRGIEVPSESPGNGWPQIQSCKEHS